MLTRLRDLFNTFLRCTAKKLSTEGFVWITLLTNLRSVYKICKSDKISQLLVFHITTPFSGCLKSRISDWSNIFNGTFYSKILSAFKLLTIFAKKASSQMSEWVENRPCVWNIELTLVTSLQIVWHCFWKGKRSGWDSKQNECLWKRVRRVWEFLSSEGFFQKGTMRNFAEFIRKYHRYFLVNFAKFVKTPFLAEHHRATVSDYSKLWREYWQRENDTKTKAYVPIWARSKLLKMVV